MSVRCLSLAAPQKSFLGWTAMDCLYFDWTVVVDWSSKVDIKSEGGDDSICRSLE
jgi:hypothetical protein